MPAPPSICWSNGSREPSQPHFQPIKYRIVAGDRDGKNKTVFAEAIIKLKVGETLWFDAAEGHGPVNALDAALRKALLDTYPCLGEMRLIDYKVRVVDSGAGTAASIRVNIESGDTKRDLGHDRRQREHHRSQLAGARRCRRIQTAQRRTAARRSVANRRERLPAAVCPFANRDTTLHC